MRVASCLCTALALAGAGCATAPAPQPTAADRQATAADGIYAAGRAALSAGDYDAAATHFRSLEVYYPASPYTYQAQMELAYAYYKNGETAAAIAAAERFIRRYPEHANADYLYYLRGLASFEEASRELAAQGPGIRPKPPMAELALRYFTELLQRFPEGKYSGDARNRIAHLSEQLARQELDAAKQYLAQGNYANAGLHAKGVSDNYPDSPLSAEAVTVANMAYRMLNLAQAGDEAAGTAAQPATAAASETAPEAAGTAGPPAVRSGPGAAPGGAPQREPWLNAQDPGRYTVQLLSTNDEQALLGVVRRYRLADAAYFQSLREGRPMYSLVYGAFATLTEARAAIEALPEALRKRRPWIRNMSDVQAAIDLNGLESPAR